MTRTDWLERQLQQGTAHGKTYKKTLRDFLRSEAVKRNRGLPTFLDPGQVAELERDNGESQPLDGAETAGGLGGEGKNSGQESELGSDGGESGDNLPFQGERQAP